MTHYMPYGSMMGSMVTVVRQDNTDLSAFIQYETPLDMNKIDDQNWKLLCSDTEVQYRMKKVLSGGSKEKLGDAISYVLTGKAYDEYKNMQLRNYFIGSYLSQLPMNRTYVRIPSCTYCTCQPGYLMAKTIPCNNCS